jgi:hypothetical protein
VSKDATPRAEPLVVAPRWGRHAGMVLLMLAGVVAMVIVRRSDLDFEDDLWAAGVLALCFWIFAIGLGSLVRNVRAGHALRLDAQGLHVPGLDVVPWASVQGTELRGYGDSGDRFRQLVVHTNALRDAGGARRYERYLFGPWSGLAGNRGKIVVPVGLLAIEPHALLAATRAFVAAASTRAAICPDVAASAQERRTTNQRLP